MVVLPAPFPRRWRRPRPLATSKRHHQAPRVTCRDTRTTDARVGCRGAIRWVPEDRRRPPQTRRSPRATRAASNRPSRIRAGIQSHQRLHPIYADRRTCSEHQHHPRWRRTEPDDTNTTRRHTPSRTSPCQRVPQGRAPPPAATGLYQRSHAARRSRNKALSMPVTRTSFPGAAVVAMVNK